jgi:hypothetical protein
VDYDALAAKHGASTPAGEGQGSSPNYPAGTQVVNPTLGQVGTGVLREGANLLSGAHAFGRKALEMIPGVSGSQFDQSMQHHQGQLDELAKPANIGEAMGKTGAEMGSYLLPWKAESAAGHAAEELPSLLRPLARVGTSAVSNAAMSGMNRESPAVGGALGAGAGILGEGGRMLANPLMRSAIPGNVGKDTAAAVLQHATGIRPSTVLKGVEGKIGEAGRNLDAAVAAHPNARLSLQPAETPVQAALDIAGRERVPGDTAEVQKLMDFLRGEGEYGPARPPLLTPQEALDARRGYGKNFVSNRQWKQVTNDAPQAAAKQGYGAITGELHAKVPGTTEADDLIHNLIPAQSGLRTLVHNDPSVAGNVMGRVGARTGALTSAAMGAAGGARTAGIPGMIAGGAAGLIAPEIMSAPAAKIAMARAMYSPATARVGRAIVTPAIQALIDNLRQQRREGQGQ